VKHNRLRGVLTHVTTAVLLVASGCGDSTEEAIRFSEQVTGATQEIERAGVQCVRSLMPILREEKPSVAAIRASRDGLKRALSEVTGRTTTLVPPGCPRSKELLQALKKYLESQGQLLKTDFDEAVRLAETDGLPADHRRTKLRRHIVHIQIAEQDAFLSLKAAQKAFVVENRLALRKDPNAEVLGFLAGIGVANERLELAGKDLGRLLAPAYRGEKLDPTQIGQFIDEAKRVLDSVKKSLLALEVPLVKGSRELRDAESAYLNGQTVTFDSDLPALVTIARDSTIDESSRKNRVDEVLRRMQEAEKGHLATLRAARDAFLKESRLVVK